MSALNFSSLRRDASKAAWSSSLGMVSAFVGATRAFRMTNASFVPFPLFEENWREREKMKQR